MKEAEIKRFIEWHIPFAVKPKRNAKTMFVNPFTSIHARDQVIEVLTKAFFKELNK